MSKNLVIVESPAKAKTIEKFLGKEYKVLSSYGHIRDLAKKSFTTDAKGMREDFTPEYEIPEDKMERVRELRTAAAKADTVWLASDEDREGEAIAWHLAEVLGLDPKEAKRIVFHEITKDAILNAIKHPRAIDLDRVNAQQARRVLDRIVGFELSPVLWKKIKPALSAGRVQSVAVRLIVDREEEIKAFHCEEYFRVNAAFAVGTSPVRTELSRRLADRAGADEFLAACQNATFEVKQVSVKPVKKSPTPPFTTSTLQQEAARKLGFTVAQTMSVAQRLYEAGHITYMRTDSVNLSSFAINSISKVITDQLGEKYLKVRHYHTHSKGAQEAHEAIRPTYVDKVTIDGTAQEKRLYTLIRRRAIASQMADAEMERTTVEIGISTRPEHFTAQGEVIKFDGFLRVYLEGRDDENADPGDDTLLPAMTVGQQLTPSEITATQRFTAQPPRYNEASLVKKMEELGIGRPSTYAPTISTIQQREYVESGDREGTERQYTILTLHPGCPVDEQTQKETVGSERGKLLPTDIGTVVNRFLSEYFPDILNYNFTAQVEERFDEIAEGKLAWQDELRTFYSAFHPEVEKALNIRLEHRVGERVLGTHPESGKTVSVKIGRFGPLVQIGDADTDERPQFASLLKGQSIETITLEEALKLFDFPRNLGDYEEKPVSVAIGRFGPYVRHNNKFVSIPKTMVPAEVTLEQAIELIEAKREAEKNKLIKDFADAVPPMQILNGRFGPYIVCEKTNYKIPKTVTSAADLTEEQCREIIAATPAKSAKAKTARKSSASSTRKTAKK
jgi:DNA topoisomerase-1